jgi:glycosyltransferase involved in cell wall biosynthesis
VRPRLRIVTVGDARVASVRHRVLAHVPALEAAGFAVSVVPRWGGAGRLGRLADLTRDAVTAARSDLLLVHRKTYPPPFARALARRRGPYVFDFDDAIDLPPPGRPARWTPRYRRNFEATVAPAQLVLCGNAELARRVAHARTALLPTPIDTARFRPDAVAAPDGPTLGWVGHSDNLPYLAALGGPLRELGRRHPALRLVLVADRPLEIPGVRVEFRRWRLDEEVACFGGIAIGLMPLDDTPWARAKCAFKALQYMALGIPTVASPVGMNREVVSDGRDGLLAADDAGWVRALDALLSDAALRRRIGEAGRRTVEERYSLTRVSARLCELLREVVRAAR